MPDAEREGPSLEPPSLFGRKKSASRPPAPDPQQTPAETSAEKPPLVLPKAEERSGLRIPRPIRRPRPTVPRPSPAPDVKADVEPDEVAEPVVLVDEQPSPAPDPQPEEPTEAHPDGEVHESAADAAPSSDAPRPRAPGRYGALAAGLLVGLFLYGLGWATIGTCRGIAGDCETVPSVLIFVAVGLVGVAAGAALLRVLAIPDPTSTSVFAVGLGSLVTFLFLTDQLDTWPMALIVPVTGAIAFFLSWWLTTSWTEADHI